VMRHAVHAELLKVRTLVGQSTGVLVAVLALPLTSLLVVTAGVSEQVAVQLIQAGVAGILHKHHSAEDLCAAIRQVVAGEVYLEKPYMASLFRTVDKTKTPSRPKLTERDKVVLRFIFQGLTNREVSSRLQISESGAKSALRQLFDKLGVRTRAQLVKVALEQFRDQL